MRVKRIICGVVLGVFVAVGVGVLSGALVGASSNTWIGTTVQKVEETGPKALPAYASQCSGVFQSIAMVGRQGLVEACVYGIPGKTRIASYSGNLYAVALPFDDTFTQLRDPCSYMSRCVYGQAVDTLIVGVGEQAFMVLDVTRNLVKYTDDGTYYRVEGYEHYNFTVGTQMARVRSLAVSRQGNWALVEFRGYGFVRVNLATREQRRVVATGNVYGTGTDPTYELAISDDGLSIAVVGWNTGLTVYEVQEGCGDVLNASSPEFFSPYTYRCPSATIDRNGLFPGFVVAQLPRFSANGQYLTVYVAAQSVGRYATIAPSDGAGSAAPPVSYVAYGDSFTSGEGEVKDMFYIPATNTATNRCHVSVRSYPFLINVGPGALVENKACSGSRTTDVLGVLRQNRTTSSISHISIGVGGNDVDLVGKLKTCLGIGICEWAKEERREAAANEIRALFPRVVGLLHEFQAENPGASMALVGYPRVVNVARGANCGPIISQLLNVDERKYLDESIVYVNKVLQAAAAYTGVSYIDVEHAFAGGRLCDTSEAFMNGIRLGDDIAPLAFLSSFKVIGAESFHPTPSGHQRVAAVINEKIHTSGELWAQTGCAGCGYDETMLLPSAYWVVHGDSPASSDTPPVKQRSLPFLLQNMVTAGAKTSLRFMPYTFEPGTAVRVELHSDIQQLTTLIAGDDGSLSGEVTIPEGVDGYHTVHVYGELLSGEQIDMYETIAVNGKDVTGEVGNNDVQQERSSAGISKPKVHQPSLAYQTTSALTVPSLLDEAVQGANGSVLGVADIGVHKSSSTQNGSPRQGVNVSRVSQSSSAYDYIVRYIIVSIALLLVVAIVIVLAKRQV